MQIKTVFCEAKFLNPIFTAFLITRGVSESEVYLLFLAFTIVTIVAEIPTGWIGDVLGRRRGLLIGTAIFAIANTAFAFASGFIAMLVIQSAKALGHAFHSGTQDALLVETSRQLNQDVTKNNGKLSSAKYLIKIFVPFTGFPLAYWYTDGDLSDALAWITAAFMTLALIPTLFLIEPGAPIKKTSLRDALRPLVEHEALRMLSLHDGLRFTSSLIFWAAYILRFKAVGFTEIHLLIWYATSHLVLMIHGSFFATWIKKRIKAHNFVNYATIFTLGGTLTIALVDNVWVLVPIAFLTWVISEMRDVYYLESMNRFIPDEVRATTGSMISFTQRIIEIPFLLVASAIATSDNKPVFWLIAAINLILVLLPFPKVEKSKQAQAAAS
ncbi:MAG: MFS transporter [bacterium]